MGAMQVFTRGTAGTTSAASQNFAIPTSNGTRPRYIWVHATEAAYVAVVPDNSGTAAAGDMLVQPGDPILLCVGSCTYFAFLQVYTPGTVQVSPVDNM